MSVPLGMIDVLREEAKEIHGEDALAGVDDAGLALGLNALGSSAVCLSGGGLRSASFALGVIQALAGKPGANETKESPEAEDTLLSKFHYLSTVSGGGYIGAWLSAWLSREPYHRVLPQLTGRAGEAGRINSVEPTPIGDLRSNSNYLTPKVGILSADTWAAAAMAARNLVLNWVLLLPLVLLSLIVIKIATVLVAWAPHAFGDQAYGVSLAVLAVVSLALTLWSDRATLWSQAISGPASPSQRRFILGNLAPLGLAGLAWTAMLHTVIGYEILIVIPGWDLVIYGAIAGVIVFAASQILTLATTTRFFAILLHPKEWRRFGRRRAWGWVVSGAVFGAVLGHGAHLLGSGSDTGLRLTLLLLFGPPWLMLAQVTAETAYVALTSADPRSDESREWFARSAGWRAAAAVFWIAGVGLALFGSLLAGWANEGAHATIGWLSTAGGISAAVGAFAGSSPRSTAKEAGPRTPISFAYDVAATLAAPAFFLLLLALGSALVDSVVLGQSLFAYLVSFDGYPLAGDGMGSWFAQSKISGEELKEGLTRLGLAFVLLAVIALAASKYININRFSLHGLYRNRLIRAFLGASHIGRKPDAFTGFDWRDNPQMKDLWPKERKDRTGPNWRPFHILNLALNVVSTRNLAWQQRKAISFTVSPLHSGAGALTPLLDQPGGVQIGFRGAFRPSDAYGGGAVQTGDAEGRTNKGISLGTAMAISGAAVNPNMGYHSSPTVSLLLTLFNLRLGWWLGNPGPAGENSWRRNGPRRAAFPLIMDAFGLTTDERPFVSLSDGGHFENLGLYEMVRRRCRFILQIDAGADPDFDFSDLGDSVRKIGIDFGVPVVFQNLQGLKPRVTGCETIVAPYHAFARIRYSAVDGAGAEDGVLIYVKPSFHNDMESAGVKAYANANPLFPHEPTTDQWFTESQFEAYRALGFEIMKRVIANTGGTFGGLFRPPPAGGVGGVGGVGGPPGGED